MLYCIYIISYIWIVGIFSLVSSIPYMDPSLELLDELKEAEIYRAVVKSMNEWQMKHVKKNINRTKREEPTACYDELGCFEASGPFGYLDTLPSKPEEINTRFLMYPARNRRRRSGSVPTEIRFEKLEEAFEWAKNGFNKSLPTKVLIHGFGSDCGYIWAYEIRSALMAVEEVNTICVDWSNGAALPNYVKASANTRLVGKQLSLLLRGLVEKNGLTLTNTHLIGFSLGAHIAGFTGADLGNLSRITGLDPAGPLFESQDTRARLDETDASFVDVIHSNGENLILGGLGSSQPMGHVDFYPNGGRMQKGCSHLFVGAVSDIIWSSAVEGRSLCNHRRAYKFFIDSVSPRCHFPAFPCDSYDQFIAGKCFPCTEGRKCGNMGYYADRSNGRGQLFLITREEEPFCAHQYLVRIETSTSSVPVRSYGKIQVTLIGDSFLNETFMLTRKEDEEMKLGESISKIVVLHPILSQPTKIEILYTAYSGWLSSGLTRWKIDKVMLMDSFGKISSVCKRALLLESGVAVTLSLYPKDCNVLNEDSKGDEENKIQQAENVHSGYMDNINERQNLVDIEAESSRAFNSRVVKADNPNKNETNNDELMKEVVEPILKTHSMKNGRSHDPEKEKIEITEPILGPTNLRSSGGHSMQENNNTRLTDIGEVSKNLTTKQDTIQEWKGHEESKALRDYESVHRSQLSTNPSPLDAIVTTVQFLPQRLARMFGQAEKYARETILPLVSTYTPRFISDFIGPREEPKYIPLHYKDHEIQQTASSKMNKMKTDSQSRSISDNTLAEGTMATSTESQEREDSTIRSSHIQKITKKTSKKNEHTPNHHSESGRIISESGVSSITSTLEDINNPILNKSGQFFNLRIDHGSHQIYQPPRKEKRQGEDASLPYTGKNLIDVTSVQDTTHIYKNNLTLIETFADTIQNLPDNFVRFLNQVQNYTRTNILPFVQSYSPRYLSDLIWIRQRPNSTIKVETNKTNTSMSQSQKVNITWSIATTLNTTGRTSTIEPVIKNSNNKHAKINVRDEIPDQYFTEVNYIEPKILENVTNEVTSEATIRSVSSSIVTLRRNLTSDILESRLSPLLSPSDNENRIQFPSKFVNSTSSEEGDLTDSEFSKTVATNLSKSTQGKSSVTEKLVLKQNVSNFSLAKIQEGHKHIQKIPKRGKVIEYTFSRPFTIVLNSNDFTTSSPSTTTKKLKSKVLLNKKYQSYIQKIPRKKENNRFDTVIRKHAWDKDFIVAHKIISVKNQHGLDVVFRISSDGRYEV